MSRHILTEEGMKYLRSGLPEERLALILDKPLPLEECRKRVEDFAIALSWAKKKGLVNVSGNIISLAGRPKTFPEREALGKISGGGDVGGEMLNVLLSRNLIRRAEDDYKKAERQLADGITTLTPELIKTRLWQKARLKPYNVEAVGRKEYPGKRHPYNQFLRFVRQKLVEMGFREMEGPTIELEFWNFDALYQAQNHPSRDWTQTYSLKYPKYGALPGKEMVARVQAAHENGWKTGSTGWGYKWDPKKASQLMPRAHDTAISPRYLSQGVEIPGKYFSLVRCYRPDVIDATHAVEFYQMGGFVIAEGLSFRDLLGLLKMFAKDLSGAEEVKFYSDYYPFVEPGAQVSVKHPEMGWIELAGAGIFRPELTEPLGIKEPVIAWGFGIDRLAMIKLGINDIRQLFSQDLKWLREREIAGL